MNAHMDRIAELQERYKRLVQVQRPDSNGPGAAAGPGPTDEGLAWPSVTSDTSNQSFCLLLELLAARDEYMRQELFRLQRTLSRQNFRGAESARRLVRRLARRAEQNTADALSTRRQLISGDASEA